MRCVILAALLALGCAGSGVPQEQKFEVKPMPTALERARTMLKAYVDGQPVGSEAEDFPAIVADVRKESPDKAEILEKGLADLKKAKGNSVEMAKGILAKLD